MWGSVRFVCEYRYELRRASCRRAGYKLEKISHILLYSTRYDPCTCHHATADSPPRQSWKHLPNTALRAPSYPTHRATPELLSFILSREFAVSLCRGSLTGISTDVRQHSFSLTELIRSCLLGIENRGKRCWQSNLRTRHTQHLGRCGLAQAEGLRERYRYSVPSGGQPSGIRSARKPGTCLFRFMLYFKREALHPGNSFKYDLTQIPRWKN